jgi:hypothetical protein
MMEPFEFFDTSHRSQPENPPPALWESVCTWNEEDEIRFVEHESNHHSHSRRNFHVPTRQEQKARRIPEPIYFPTLVLAW